MLSAWLLVDMGVEGCVDLLGQVLEAPGLLLGIGCESEWGGVRHPPAVPVGGDIAEELDGGRCDVVGVGRQKPAEHNP